MRRTDLVNEIEEKRSLLLYLQKTGQLDVAEEADLKVEIATLEELLDSVRR